MLLENIYKDWWGQQSVKEASNQQKLNTILITWLWRVRKCLFHFCSLNGECVTCVCLQCSRRKLNWYGFLGKTATIDKCSHLWPNFGKSHNFTDITKTHFKYSYTFPCNSKHFYCIGNINQEKAKFSSCFSELNIQCAKCTHKGDFPKFGHI